MKKTCILMVIVLLLSTGCGLLKPVGISPDRLAESQSADIIKFFKEKDSEGLKDMFCKTVKTTHDLDKEIQEAFDFIDGEIVSHDEPQGDICSATMGSFEIRKTALDGGIRNIKTDTGKTYLITFCSYCVYNENTDNVGLTEIGVYLQDGHIRGEDYPESAKYRFGKVIY